MIAALIPTPFSASCMCTSCMCTHARTHAPKVASAVVAAVVDVVLTLARAPPHIGRAAPLAFSIQRSRRQALAMSAPDRSAGRGRRAQLSRARAQSADTTTTTTTPTIDVGAVEAVVSVYLRILRFMCQCVWTVRYAPYP